MALSGIQLSAGIVVGVNKPVDGKYGPYPDLATAKADIGVTLRYLGLTVGIETGGVVEEYWWESGTADADLVAKGGGGGGTWGSITGTLSDQTDLQSALDAKEDTITATTSADYYRGDKTFATLDKAAVGLSNVDNTSDANKPVSTATQTALDAKTNKLITTNRQTASYTLVLADADKLVEMNVATANDLTIPLNSSVAFATGTQILLAQYGAGQTTIVPTSGVTVRSNGAKLKLNVQYSGATLIKIGTDEWYLFGDIVA
jgi:hypothetical protein